MALNESVQQKTEENRESAPDHIHLLEEVADNPIDLILEQTVPGIDNVRFDDKEITAVMVCKFCSYSSSGFVGVNKC